MGYLLDKSDGTIVTSFAKSLDWMDITRQGTHFEQNRAYRVIALAEKTKEIVREVHLQGSGLKGGGIIEPRTFSILRIFFELDLVEGSAKDELQGALRELAQKALVHFLNIFSEHSSHVDIDNPKISDIPVLTVLSSASYQFTYAGVDAEFQFDSDIVNWNSPQSTGHLKENFEGKWIENFQKHLASGLAMPVYKSILLDARRQSFLYKNFDLSIVLVGSSFETFASSTLRKIYQYLQKNTVQLKGMKSSKDIEQFCTETSIDKLLSAIAQSVRPNLKANTEHLIWKERAYKIRNNILHRGVSGHDESQARKAFEATTAYINSINGLVNSHFDNHKLDPNTPIT